MTTIKQIPISDMLIEDDYFKGTYAEEERERRVRRNADNAYYLLDDAEDLLAEMAEDLKDTNDYDKVDDLLEAVRKLKWKVADFQ